MSRLRKGRSAEGYSAVANFTFSGFCKLLPRTVNIEKEALYAEGLQLRRVLNEAADENTKLRTRLMILERNSQKSLKKKGRSSVHLNTSIKFLLLKAREENNALKVELSKLRNESSANLEAEVEVAELTKEIVRLRRLLDERGTAEQAVSTYKKKAESAEHKLKNLKEVYSKMVQLNKLHSEQSKKAEETLHNFRQKFADYESKFMRESFQLRKKLKLKESNVSELEDLVNNMKREMTRMQQDISGLRKSQISPYLQLRDKNREIERLKGELAQKQREYEERLEEERKVLTQEPRNSAEEEEQEFADESVQPPKLKDKQTLLAELGQFLGYRLLIQRLNVRSMLSILKESGSQRLLVAELFKMLEGEPFYVNTEEEIELLLNYFYQVEELRPDLSVPIDMFEARLLALIPEFQIWPEPRTQQLKKELGQALIQFKKPIKSELRERADGGGLVTKSHLESVLREFQLSEDCIRYAVASISLTSAGLDELNFEELFKRLKKAAKEK